MLFVNELFFWQIWSTFSSSEESPPTLNDFEKLKKTLFEFCLEFSHKFYLLFLDFTGENSPSEEFSLSDSINGFFFWLGPAMTSSKSSEQIIFVEKWSKISLKQNKEINFTMKTNGTLVSEWSRNLISAVDISQCCQLTV